MQSILIHRFDNGLQLLAEQMDYLESVAFSLQVPGGYVYDPDDREGLANFTCEMALRGCGERSARQFIEDLDNLGVNYNSGVASEFAGFRGAMASAMLDPALELVADFVRRPHLPADQLEDGRLVCQQEIRALDDDVAQQMMLELRRRTFNAPYGRAHHGTLESLASITLGDIRGFFEKMYRPDGAVLSVAGKFDWNHLIERIESLLGDWSGVENFEPVVSPPTAGDLHIEYPSNQTHIGLSYAAPSYIEDDYFPARAAVGVLADGMTSRFFTEVREKRGLVYSVGASYDSLRDAGAVFCYASSTTDRAQETLDVMRAELVRLGEGIEPDELDRLKVQLKTGLLMEQESSRSRCATLVGDWRLLGRVRTRNEVLSLVEGLTCEAVNAWLAENPPRDFRVVTIGKKALESPDAVS
ncbi:M16 family metallopeptidase [Lignipirellula cremea]|uniref:Peptidase M16 inactive domain protein n=1 Tax=Lignipirellula cremea TaxID=2528010 RepID=A0A518DS89_9BACT|nr:pitrilysin family protein [Lignipirellula cremea]QDU94701.1 Peptidase M16 inactive domain protein [Lignipirellula cremea]